MFCFSPNAEKQTVNEKNAFGRELPSSPKATSQSKTHCEGTDWGTRDQASSLRQLVTCLRV